MCESDHINANGFNTVSIQHQGTNHHEKCWVIFNQALGQKGKNLAVWLQIDLCLVVLTQNHGLW